MSESSRSDLPSETTRGGDGSLPPNAIDQAAALSDAARSCNRDSESRRGVRRFAGRAQFFHDRRFAGSANGQVADADDEATERAFAKNPVPIKKEPQLHDALVDKRETVEQSAQKRRAHAVAAFEDDVDRKLLEIFKRRPWDEA